jgi:short subunit dehydrogenase-like uncharacterized protein
VAPLAVLGATGFTGRLVVEQARSLGLPLRLVGRRREALAAAARDDEDVRTADARDERALREAFDGAFAVVSLAGPFLATGTAPVAAAIAAGAHYLDTTGAQAFARLVSERFGRIARERSVVLLTAFGIEYAPGDLAARLAADGLEPLDEVVVAYSPGGGRASRGTRRTVARILAQPLVAWSDGRLVPSRLGRTVRRVSFPFGEADVIEWGGGEPLTVPRHTSVRDVRSYVRFRRAAAPFGRFGRIVAPFFALASRFGPEGPSEEERRTRRFAIVAEARGPSGGRRVTLTGSDPYGLTALLVVRAAEALRAGEARSAGALAPAEAFDARSFVERLAPLLEIAGSQSL